MTASGVCEVCHTVQPLTPNENIRKHSSPLFPDLPTKPPACKGSGKPALLSWDVKCPGCSAKVLYVATRGVNDHMDDGSPWSRRVHDDDERCVGSKDWAEDLDAALEAKWIAPDPAQEEASCVGSGTPSETILTADGIPFSKELLDDYPDWTPAVDEMAAAMQPPSEIPCEAPRIQGEMQLPAPESPSLEDLWGGGASAPPKPKAPRRKRQQLEGRAAELASWFKEAFFVHESSRPRSVQQHVGPSEAGAECERRLAYKLSGHEKVNYSRKPWAAFVGTMMHAGCERIIETLQGSTQRFLVEQRVEFGSAVMPGGTLDLFDRLHGRVLDWKNPGKSSLSKMHLDGPGRQYRTQLHLYGYGAKRLGEDVQEVALVGLPRESGNLDEIYAFVEDYDEQIALDAIARIERIASDLWRMEAPDFPKTTSFLCQWCDFYLPGATDETRGCRG